MPEHDRDFELAKLPEHGKTSRTLIICATIVLSLFLLCATYIKVNENQWISLAIAIFGPSGIGALIIRWLYSKYRAYKKRTGALEIAVESLERENRDLRDRLARLPDRADGPMETELPHQELD